MSNLNFIIEIAVISPLVVLAIILFIYFKEKAGNKYKLTGFSFVLFLLVANLVGLIVSFIVVLIVYPTAQGPLSWFYIFGPFSVAFGSLIGFQIWRTLSIKRKNES